MVFGSDTALEGVMRRLKVFREEPYVRQAGLKAFIHQAEEVF